MKVPEYSYWGAGGFIACMILIAAENSNGFVSMVAPTEAHAFGWLAIIIVCVMIARSFIANGVGMPSIRSVAMPRMKIRYAKRVRRYI